MPHFRDRADAGARLAGVVTDVPDLHDPLVLALPRGGVPVAFEVARALGAELDVFVVRKLGVPGHEELAMGAIASGGILVLNDAVVHDLGVAGATVDEVAVREGRELERREREYRGAREAVDTRGRTVILVDDGLATGATMRAAITALRAQEPRRLIVAVPTAATETCDEIGRLVDEIVCAETPAPFHGVGMWYENFSQTTDAEVKRLLATPTRAAAPPRTDPNGRA